MEEAKLEPGDLKMRVSFAFVCEGSLEDFFIARSFLRSLSESRLIYQIASAQKLYISKNREMKK